jgi:hypothetical protein
MRRQDRTRLVARLVLAGVESLGRVRLVLQLTAVEVPEQ